MAEVAAQITRTFNWTGPVGIGLPAPIKSGVAMMAANISPKWVGTNADDLFTQVTGCDCHMINDADAAGLAEMEFGAGKGHPGTVIMLTLGTGIGTAIFYNGHLLPNTEFGHLDMKGKDAEHRVSAAVRETEGLSWKEYAKRLNKYLLQMEKLFWQDLFIVGGGISKQSNIFRADLLALPFQDLVFDTTISIHVLHLIKNWKNALVEIGRVTKKDSISVAFNKEESPAQEIRNAYDRACEELGHSMKHPGMRERGASRCPAA